MLDSIVANSVLLILALAVATLSISGRRAQPIVQPFYAVGIAMMATQLFFGLGMFLVPDLPDLMRLELTGAVDGAIIAVVVATLLLTVAIPLFRNQPIAFTPSINAHLVSRLLVGFLSLVMAYLIYAAVRDGFNAARSFSSYVDNEAVERLKDSWATLLLLSTALGAAFAWFYLRKVEPLLIRGHNRPSWQD